MEMWLNFTTFLERHNNIFFFSLNIYSDFNFYLFFKKNYYKIFQQKIVFIAAFNKFLEIFKNSLQSKRMVYEKSLFR